MLRLFTCIIYLVIFNVSNAQQFSVLYDYNDDPNDGVSIIKTSDSYVITTNYVNLATSQYSVIIATFNDEGQVTWDTSLTDDENQWSLTIGSTSSIIPQPTLEQNWIVCNKHLGETDMIPAILKMDNNGNHIDTILFNEFPGINLLTVSSVQANGKIHLLCQPTNASNNYIIKCNSSGEIISYFTSIIGIQSDSKFITDVGDGLIIGGRYLPNTVANSWQYVRKFDYDGNVLWTFQYSNGLEQVGVVNAIPLENGNTLFATTSKTGSDLQPRYRPFIGEIDEVTGDTLWTKKYFAADSIHRLHNFKRLSSGEYIGVGETRQRLEFPEIPVVTTAFMFKLDSEFNLLWKRIYTPIGFAGNVWPHPTCHVNDFIENEDGGITALGRAFTYTGTGLQSGYIQDSWLLRVDSDGCLISGCAVDITEHEPQQELLIYPNPASSILHLQFPHIDKWQVIIYNMQGALVKEEQPNQLVQYGMDIQELPSGVYKVLCSDANGKVYAQKLIKE
jgi:hypothetical protein